MAYSEYTERKGHSPNTATVISSKVRIMSKKSLGRTVRIGSTAQDFAQVGVIASFDPTQSRSIEPIRGIGYGDQVAELIPGYTEPMSISVNRSAQYLSNLQQVFGYSSGVDGFVRSLSEHKWPFDIHQEVVFSTLVMESGAVANANGDKTNDEQSSPSTNDGTSLSAMRTTFEACWFSDIGTSFTSDTALVQENGTIMVSSVYDDAYVDRSMVSTGNQSASARTKTT